MEVSTPAGAVVVREVTAADFPQWAPLWAGYNTFYKRVLPDAVTQATWSRFFDEAEPVHALVAEQDGQLQPRLLADARDQRRSASPLQQRGRTLGLHRLPPAALGDRRHGLPRQCLAIKLFRPCLSSTTMRCRKS